MSFRGRVKNGIVMLDEPDSIPEGAAVRVDLIRPRPEQKAVELLDQWLSDDSGYDEESWPALKSELECNRLSSRKLFDD